MSMAFVSSLKGRKFPPFFRVGHQNETGENILCFMTTLIMVAAIKLLHDREEEEGETFGSSADDRVERIRKKHLIFFTSRWNTQVKIQENITRSLVAQKSNFTSLFFQGKQGPNLSLGTTADYYYWMTYLVGYTVLKKS